ncbi:uncharacterized protein LOC107800751 [Nicotiana tabacum]|uniref:Uncharacterized protein LOC107800751 n=1 Tax=Nicotiana tabacum TaxID=4097 RepID=A0A1S4AS08_TOBAC|nr:PREDICTED: uncharacterized protein LOC107800751 [Nicotiana tabacum]
MEVESPERGKIGGIAMEIPASDGATLLSPPRIPPRILQKLSEPKPKTSPSTAEEIDAKLRGADLRRQKFYEYLSSKARPKPRSPSQTPTHGEDLGQRLEAKLQAAEEKRMSILAKAKLRLAKLDELRQAAKTGAEMRFRQERAELGTKVELRVQQAEVNRMLLLKANRQRRATLRERTSQSLLRRMARESKYKERVRAAIYQKRAAAEKKRMGLLEAEKRRACARVMQARTVAKSVSHQEEVKRREMKIKIEDKLQRAKRQRAEYLMQRGKSPNSFHGSYDKIHDQADLLSRKLARCWKQFLTRGKTTFHLAKAYNMLSINERSAKLMPFEQLAMMIESFGTLQTAKGLLDRLELRFKLLRDVNSAASTFGWGDIDHLLKRVASPKRKVTPRRSLRSGGVKKTVSNSPAARAPLKLSRYPVRIVLCAYMVLGHPDAVFSGKGEREIALAKSAEKFVREFELLVRIILNGPTQTSDGHSDCGLASRKTFKSQLAEFDSAWCSYLNSFVVWKVKDAQSLEEDLVRAACQLELSMIQKCRITPEGDSVALTHDLKAIQKQVTEDQRLLREKVLNISGDAGIERMDNAISDTRSKYFEAKENGSPLSSPILHSISPTPTALPSASSPLGGTSKGENLLEVRDQKPNRVVRSLFRDEPHPKVGSSAKNSMQASRSDEGLEMENELIVNESLHGQHLDFAESPKVADKYYSSIEDKVRETMEKAFWDSVMESMRKDEPGYNRVVDLMREARDVLCSLAPQSWRQEINEVIDIDILSQLLISGKLDMDYLQKIMDFALVTLQKLSSPAKEDELKANCQKLFREIADICQDGAGNSFILALVRGLRFILEEIQLLKQEISKAKIRMLEPILKGPAAFDYLKKAFTKRYGLPSVAMTALPLTRQWLLSVKDSMDQEWDEHKEAQSGLTSGQDRFLPSATLRTGGSFSVKTYKNHASPLASTEAIDECQECTGDKVDILVRLGLLKLVNAVSGLTQEGLPETMHLNFFRLRVIQAKIQKIIVIATSILVQRQVLLSMQMVSSAVDMDKIVQGSVKALSELFDSNSDAGIQEIIETLGKPLEHGNYGADVMKLQQIKEIMARMLSKSLQAGDAIFVRISRAIYLAGRGVVLGGTRRQGRELAEMALQQVGATALIDEVVEAASVLIVATRVTVNVHGPWYAQLVDNM